MTDDPGWVVDTSVWTHLARSGHLELLHVLAPGGVVVVPDDVHTEIEAGRSTYAGIVSVNSVEWAELATLTDDEALTQLQVKAAMGGSPTEHLGECAVIAVAEHRGLVALLDERQAITQAGLREVASHDTLWLVIEAYLTVFDEDATRAAQVVDDLLATDMHLPVDDGAALMAWAYLEGLLPRTD